MYLMTTNIYKLVRQTARMQSKSFRFQAVFSPPLAFRRFRRLIFSGGKSSSVKLHHGVVKIPPWFREKLHHGVVKIPPWFREKLHHGVVKISPWFREKLHHGVVKIPPWCCKNSSRRSKNFTMVEWRRHHGEVFPPPW